MKAVLIGLCLAVSTGAFAQSSDSSRPQIGRQEGNVHPQIVLPSLDGTKTYAISDFRGKKVLLIQFASW